VPSLVSHRTVRSPLFSIKLRARCLPALASRARIRLLEIDERVDRRNHVGCHWSVEISIRWARCVHAEASARACVRYLARLSSRGCFICHSRGSSGRSRGRVSWNCCSACIASLRYQRECRITSADLSVGKSAPRRAPSQWRLEASPSRFTSRGCNVKDRKSLFKIAESPAEYACSSHATRGLERPNRSIRVLVDPRRESSQQEKNPRRGCISDTAHFGERERERERESNRATNRDNRRRESSTEDRNFFSYSSRSRLPRIERRSPAARGAHIYSVMRC